MYRRLKPNALAAGACVTLVAFFLTAAGGLSSAAGASTLLNGAVSQTPVTWTPNVFAGPPPSGQQAGCNSGYFGAATACQSEVYSTAYVNGEVVVAGAFTEACAPGPLKGTTPLCTAGTEVTRDDIFAYKPGQKKGVDSIDLNFAPQLNAGPAWTVVAGPAGSNTVYVGGAFSTVTTAVNGTVTTPGLVQLNVDPAKTTGVNSDGTIVTGAATPAVPTFKGHVSNGGVVRDLVLSPDNTALYVGGQFSDVDSTGGAKFSDGTPIDGLARLNATTGALDEAFPFAISVQVDPPNTPVGPIKIEAMALSTDGTLLSFSGAFLDVTGPVGTAKTVTKETKDRLAIVDTGETAGTSGQKAFGAPSVLSDWYAPILANYCQKEHDYVRGVDFSPNASFLSSGGFLAIATTGSEPDGTTVYDGSTKISACDVAARFDVNTANNTSSGTAVDVPPAWMNYSGQDSYYSVAVAGDVVYAGGHNRWVDNYCGINHLCGSNAELVSGLSALDANTGIGLAWWHPLTLRGEGTMYLSTFPAGTYDGKSAGLVLGTDVNFVGANYHSENAIFPLTTSSSADAGGPIPSGIFHEEGGPTVVANQMCLDGGAGTTGTTAELNTCSNDAAQNWTVMPTNTLGTDEIQLDNTTLCLDASTTPPEDVLLSACSTTSPTEQWTPEADNTLKNVGAANACLTDPGSTSTPAVGTVLEVASCGTASTPGPNQVWPLPVAQAPPPPPPVGEIFSQEVQTTTSQVPCLDDQGHTLAAGNQIVLMTCVGNPEQSWTVKTETVNGATAFTFELGNTNYCLDAPETAPATSVPALLEPCTTPTTPSQEWTWAATTTHRLQNLNASAKNSTPYCLVDPLGNADNGAKMQVSTCTKNKETNPAADESWRLPTV